MLVSSLMPRIGECVEERYLVAGYAQHLGDDFDRDLRSVVGDQIALAVAVEVVEEGAGNLLDAVTKSVDRPRGECPRYQASRPRMLGWIGHEQRRRFGRVEHAGIGFRQHPLHDGKGRSVLRFEGPEPAVAEHVTDDLGVCGDPSVADDRGHPAPSAKLLDELIHVLGVAVVDRQLGKWVTPASEQLQRRTGQSVAHQPVRSGLDVRSHVVRPRRSTTKRG